MKIVFIGIVDFSRQALLKLIDLNAEIKGVITKKTSPFNADFSDLTDICKTNNIPIHYTKDINHKDCLAWIKDKKPDVLFCFGWSQLIKSPLLHIAPLGTIGFHPSLLPKNRGRHPIIWALALGLDKTGSSFFFMDEGADSGDILSQVEIPIDYNDNARTLYSRITNIAIKQIEDFLPVLRKNNYERISQDHNKATYWRKRTQIDGLIDWRMSSRGIYNLVRALSQPYVGANATYKSQEFKIWAVSEKLRQYPQYIEPGKVIEENNTNNSFIIKCGINAITVIEHELTTLPKTGEYL
ncbi:MAG: methionyl-tRNA formyltransferase [Deltaproteobacteria bacterium]|nr:methionyl-tRNA formyltransferase [Deltaproteobacteria bacterium]